MSTYKFSAAQRYAIFLAHGMKCYMCKVPLDYASMAVDHVLPERLLATPSLFDATRSTLGLPASFELNSFENWMPTCAPCNGKKSALLFKPSPLILVELQQLAEKADRAREICAELVSTRQVSIALGVLERALEGGRSFDGSTQERLFALLRFASERELVPRGEPLRLTKSFRLVATTVEDAARWGATHWSIPPHEPGELALAVLFRVERGECVECGLIQRVFQPIHQEGGGDPICDVCLSNLGWMVPVALGDLPTHVTQI